MIKPKKKLRVKVNGKLSAEVLTYDFRNVAGISKFVSDRGRILPRTRTGLSAKAQRHVQSQIKRARYMALMPFVAGL